MNQEILINKTVSNHLEAGGENDNDSIKLSETLDEETILEPDCYCAANDDDDSFAGYEMSLHLELMDVSSKSEEDVDLLEAMDWYSDSDSSSISDFELDPSSHSHPTVTATNEDYIIPRSVSFLDPIGTSTSPGTTTKQKKVRFGTVTIREYSMDSSRDNIEGSDTSYESQLKSTRTPDISMDVLVHSILRFSRMVKVGQTSRARLIEQKREQTTTKNHSSKKSETKNYGFADIQVTQTINKCDSSISNPLPRATLYQEELKQKPNTPPAA